MAEGKLKKYDYIIKIVPSHTWKYTQNFLHSYKWNVAAPW